VTKRNIRNILTVVILVATVCLFVWYFVKHPEYWEQLKQVSPWTIVWVVFVNFVMLAVLAGIYDATLRLCGKRLERRENFLLTSYSTIVNFFGPLQSGPGVRATYLKLKHQVRLRDYTLATLLYYAVFAGFSALFLLVGTRPWWQTLLAVAAVAGVSVAVIRLFQNRDKQAATSQFRVTRTVLATLVVLTFMQVSLTAVRYYIELQAVNPAITVGQSISYAGAANFALFVSITPDGVGIREAFLFFSQDIHGVPTEDIVSANLIDRASYLVFLGLLFLVVLSLHAKEKLGLSNLRAGRSPTPKNPTD
jgi:uncharacterized membrane protein YbhN (UPF0104 family)